MHRVLLIVLLCSVPLLGQAEWPKPNWQKAEVLRCRDQQQPSTYAVGKYQVKLVLVSSFGGENSCQSYLVEPSGHEIPLLCDWTVSVFQGTGEDLFGDGNPGLILEGFSGGAHCCYTYTIADLGDAPLVLSPVHNQTPFLVFKDPATKQFRILTSDGAFDYFDGLCHACAPFPRVVLQATVGGLRDVSSQFVDQYDSDIALAAGENRGRRDRQVRDVGLRGCKAGRARGRLFVSLQRARGRGLADFRQNVAGGRSPANQDSDYQDSRAGAVVEAGKNVSAIFGAGASIMGEGFRPLGLWAYPRLRRRGMGLTDESVRLTFPEGAGGNAIASRVLQGTHWKGNEPAGIFPPACFLPNKSLVVGKSFAAIG